MRIAIVAALASIASSACWTGASPSAPIQNTARSTKPEPEPPFPRHSVWVGTYRCNQGLSSVRLTIDATAQGVAIARYDFGPVESNPTVPAGAYELTGTLTATPTGFTGELEAARWIDHPPGYFMVGLTIDSYRHGRRLRGTIHHETCSDFEVKRVS